METQRSYRRVSSRLTGPRRGSSSSDAGPGSEAGEYAQQCHSLAQGQSPEIGAADGVADRGQGRGVGVGQVQGCVSFLHSDNVANVMTR